jgi:1,4-dihydroxy-2-naphthoate octaprenyltransferase
MSEADKSYSKLQIWILASRPKTLWAAISPVIIGGALALADGHQQHLSWIAAALGAILIQIGTNFANDLFDYEKATDNGERLGPLRVTQAGLVTPTQMRVATAVAFGLAMLIGVYLIYRGGWPILAIGVLSILCGILYTAGPYPLGYHGLGDIFVLIFFGPVAVGGTFYVIAQDINWLVILAGLPPGLLAVAILVVNNLRDIESDARAGKRTLAVRFGRTFTKIQYLVSIVLALSFAPIHYLATDDQPQAMLSLLAALVALGPLSRVFRSREGEVLNRALADTGKVMFAYALTFSVGWLL